jgi:hypothetical protein
LGRDDAEFAIDVAGLTLTFSDPEMVGNAENVGAGHGVFAGVTIHLNDTSGQTYSGTLPLGLSRSNDRKSIRKLLGEPDDAGDVEDEEYWDQWINDEYEVTVFYSEDGAIFETLSIYLPEEF